MRLGQLARKLELRPAEIVEFLATKSILIEDDVNSKVEENCVALVFRQFAPDKEVEHIPDADIPTVSAQDDLQNDVQAPDEIITAAETSGNELQVERNEVIKAAKVELSGLKVLGKIELLETKKKQADTPQENSETERPPQEFKGEKRSQNYKKTQRPAKNPIALQRERETLAAQKKREEELQLKKERRTQNYLKKVKAHQPTKAAKLIKEESEEMSAAELAEPPKTLWGKFIKWLTT